MPYRPLARRAPLVTSVRRARSAARPAALAAALLALGACRSGVQVSPLSKGVTATTVLTCVAEVAEHAGYADIERRTEDGLPTLRARRVPRGARRMDVLTVSLQKLTYGMRALAQTFDMRPSSAAVAAGRDAAARAEPAVALVRPVSWSRGPSGPAAEDVAPRDAATEAWGGTIWRATAPSAELAELRETVLERCGSLR